jgi:sugar phosphate isomerase/epimerase
MRLAVFTDALAHLGAGEALECPGHDRTLQDTIRLASELGVARIVCMSGGRAELAGAGWFPGLERETEEYWRRRVLPYWDEVGRLAEQSDPALRLCLELEPGAAVFNVSTFERLAASTPCLALNLDPSHFFWQSIDPLAVVGRLATRIGFAHGKDVVVDHERVATDGVLDRTAWRYAVVGRGHSARWWQLFADALRRAGYDDVISIEHEDDAVTPEAGLLEAAAALRPALNP